MILPNFEILERVLKFPNKEVHNIGGGQTKSLGEIEKNYIR